MIRINARETETKEELKVNPLRDNSIAETAIKNEAILVSDDINLQQVVSEFGGSVVDRLKFLSSTSPAAE
jgi:rRNA-processing protein FCF1